MNEVSKYMSTQIFSIGPDKYAHEAVDKMYENKVSAILVKEGEKYVGIITKTDWMFLVLKGECDPKAMKVSAVMTKIVNTIDEKQTIAEVCSIIETKKIRQARQRKCLQPRRDYLSQLVSHLLHRHKKSARRFPLLMEWESRRSQSI